MIDNTSDPKKSLSDFLKDPIPLNDSIIESALPSSSPPPYPVPNEIFEWLQGKSPAPPASTSKMMGDITTKITYYLAYSIIQRGNSISRLISQLETLENKLFPSDNIDNLNQEDLKKRYNTLSSSINNFLELTRRFSAQSKDISTDPERDNIITLVRSLDADTLNAFKRALSSVINRKTGENIDPSKNSSKD